MSGGLFDMPDIAAGVAAVERASLQDFVRWIAEERRLGKTSFDRRSFPDGLLLALGAFAVSRAAGVKETP